jgi:hypothetical protein
MSRAARVCAVLTVDEVGQRTGHDRLHLAFTVVGEDVRSVRSGRSSNEFAVPICRRLTEQTLFRLPRPPRLHLIIFSRPRL